MRNGVDWDMSSASASVSRMDLRRSVPLALRDVSIMPPLERYRTSPLSALRRSQALGLILMSPRVLMAVEDAVTVESVGDFTLKGISRPVAAYNVLSAVSSKI